MSKLGFEHPLSSKTEEDYDFDKWYEETYGNPNFKHPRSSRYYELRKSWKASKEFYSKSGQSQDNSGGLRK